MFPEEDTWYADDAVPKRKPLGNWLLETFEAPVRMMNGKKKSRRRVDDRDMAACSLQLVFLLCVCVV
jgi:hypothetical protein